MTLNFGGLAQVNSASEEDSPAGQSIEHRSHVDAHDQIRIQAQQFVSSNPYDLNPLSHGAHPVLSHSSSQYSEFNALNIASNASNNFTPQTRTIENKERQTNSSHNAIRFSYGNTAATNMPTRIT